ncbi:MAG: hypothetical protein EBU90_13970 [Proteobacteria bacterium]|nr:hypothetical protein [Pseudomonadota bacterium]
MQFTQESKSQLARLLATENLIVEHRKVPTAYFDMKNRKLVIPILKDEITNDLYDLFVGHEVSHALHTPPEGWHDSVIDLKIPKVILNVVEDARIEKLIKRRYPGLRASFSKAYKTLHDRNFFETDGLDVDELNLLDRLNLHFKIGATLCVNFSTEEKKIISMMEDMETFDDVIKVSKLLADLYRKNEKEKIRQSASEEKNEEKQEDDSSMEFEESEDFDDSEELDEIPQNTSDDEDEESEDDDSEDDDSGDNENEEESNSDELEDDIADEDIEIESITDEAFRKNEKDLISTDSKDYIYADLPSKIHLDQIIIPYDYILNRLKSEGHSLSKDTFNEFRTKSNKVVSYLVKEFEMRKNADQMKRASTAKTGELNMNKIYSYKFNDDIFKRLTVVPGGKSHGLVMFMDWSGSMGTHLHQTIKQLLNLVLFCKKVNIPFEVYAFNDQFHETYDKPKQFNKSQVDIKDGELRMLTFNLLNLFSSKMGAAEIAEMGSLLLDCSTVTWKRGRSVAIEGFPTWMSLRQTPINETIIAAMDIVPKFQKENKLQVVNTVFLTDGEGHPLRYVHGFGGVGTTSNHYMNLRDPKTKEIARVESGSFQAFTSSMLKLLKKRTNSNVVGFFLVSPRDFRDSTKEFFPLSIDMDQIKDKFMKEKSVVCTTSGYDEFYIMRAELDVDEDELEVKSTTTRGLVNAFTKYNTNKIVNRVILNKFIGMIA